MEEIHQKNEGAKLLITVDCGITSVKEIALANQLGMEVIVTDHHQPRSGRSTTSTRPNFTERCQGMSTLILILQVSV